MIMYDSIDFYTNHVYAVYHDSHNHKD